jgi:citrate synthase
VIDIRKLYGQTGMFTYDPGFLSTASCQSAITYIDGDKGELLYRGYPIEQLATNCDFLGNLPFAAVRRIAQRTTQTRFHPNRHAPHHGARANAIFLARLSP